MQARDFRTSASLIERFVASGAAAPEDYIKLAAARRATGDLARALEAATAAIRIEPRAFPPLLMAGSLLQALARREEAAAMYARAIAAAPDEARLPPPFRNALAQARDHVAAVAAWRARVAAVDLTGLEPGARARAEAFRANILSGPRADGGPGQFLYPGVSETEFFDTAAIPGVRALETETQTILEEFRRVTQARLPELVSFDAHSGRADAGQAGARQWTAVRLIAEGARVDANAALCPRTMALHAGLMPPAIAGRSPNLMFSLLDARTVIPAHTGVTNTRLVLHLPLIVPPEGCSFRVGATTRAWEAGQAMVFDDSIEHEARNDSDTLRVVLLCDIWRPELSGAERVAVAGLMGI